MVKDYVAEDDNDIEVELPDYEHPHQAPGGSLYA